MQKRTQASDEQVCGQKPGQTFRLTCGKSGVAPDNRQGHAGNISTRCDVTSKHFNILDLFGREVVPEGSPADGSGMKTQYGHNDYGKETVVGPPG